MSDNLCHNGCDTLMLGFDYELRRHGFAGNSCQIILELSKQISPTKLEQRLVKLVQENPILHSRPARGLKPRWKPTKWMPRVRVHADATKLQEQIFNEPLDIHSGELIRFDIIGCALIFTWAHALMDAKSAEYFLALLGDDQLTVPEPEQDQYSQRAKIAGNFRARVRQAWRSLERIEKFKRAMPVSLATRHPPAVKKMKCNIVALSPGDSEHIRENSNRLCGFLGDTTFHLAATLVELHRLQQRTGCATASYVVPIPVGLRRKGTRAPLFSNQITMILHQFLPCELETTGQAAAAIKDQRASSVRTGAVDSSIALAQLFRALPLRLYMWLIKHELRGEICSLFFGDTNIVDPSLNKFFGEEINDFAHVPAVTVPPGIGIVYYRFRDQFHFTLVHAEGTLTENETYKFIEDLRQRLLHP
jgi:hypothetical protein